MSSKNLLIQELYLFSPETCNFLIGANKRLKIYEQCPIIQSVKGFRDEINSKLALGMENESREMVIDELLNKMVQSLRAKLLMSSSIIPFNATPGRLAPPLLLSSDTPAIMQQQQQTPYSDRQLSPVQQHQQLLREDLNLALDSFQGMSKGRIRDVVAILKAMEMGNINWNPRNAQVMDIGGSHLIDLIRAIIKPSFGLGNERLLTQIGNGAREPDSFRAHLGLREFLQALARSILPSSVVKDSQLAAYLKRIRQQGCSSSIVSPTPQSSKYNRISKTAEQAAAEKREVGVKRSNNGVGGWTALKLSRTTAT